MARSSTLAAAAAAAALLGLAVHSEVGFAVPPAQLPVAPGSLAAPQTSAAWEPHAAASAEATSSEATTALNAFALSAALGLAAGTAKSRLGRRAVSFKSPEETYKTVMAGGEARLGMTPREVILQGIVTGFYIGFGGVLCSTVGGSVGARLPAGLQRLLFGAVGFPLSIFLTTIAGGQGFTPNVSVMSTAFLRKGSDDKDRDQRINTMMKNLAYAYLGNTIGLVTIAFLANLASLPAVPASIHIAKHKVFDLTFMQVLVRGILGGWLIGLAVWTAQAAEDVASKFVTIWLCISTYVICQYEHCLANLFFVPCAIFAGAKITWGQFILWNLIPSTIGNLLGGFGMLAGFYRLVYGSKAHADEQAK